MSQFDDAAKQVATLLLMSALLMAGCSGSNDSPMVFEDNNVGSNINSNATTGQADANDGETSVSMPDPLIQIVTRVDFEITVPVYQSNALQVSLTWGGTQEDAAWVG